MYCLHIRIMCRALFYCCCSDDYYYYYCCCWSLRMLQLRRRFLLCFCVSRKRLIFLHLKKISIENPCIFTHIFSLLTMNTCGRVHCHLWNETTTEKLHETRKWNMFESHTFSHTAWLFKSIEKKLNFLFICADHVS